MSNAYAIAAQAALTALLLACSLSQLARAQNQPAANFHSNPACWQEPRIFHIGAPPEELATRVNLIEVAAAVPVPGKAVVSPNGAYRFWVRAPDTTTPPPWGAGLIVDVEKDQRPALLFERIAQPINPRWLTEKLIYLRVVWGREVYSDLIFDVEQAALIYHEQALYGANAYHQARESGAACEQDASAVNLPASTNTNMPPALPGKNAMIGLLTLPTIFGPPETGGVVAAANPVPVPVYASPEAGARKLGEPVAMNEFEYREYTYEGAAAVVYEKRPGWYLIGRENDKRAWLSAKSAGEFLPIGALLVNRQAYLNQHWDGKIWESPSVYKARNSRLPNLGAQNAEHNVSIRAYRQVGDGLWLQVETLRNNPCEGGDATVVDRGWVPAYSTSGELVAGYYSRGC